MFKMSSVFKCFQQKAKEKIKQLVLYCGRRSKVSLPQAEQVRGIITTQTCPSKPCSLKVGVQKWLTANLLKNQVKAKFVEFLLLV